MITSNPELAKRMMLLARPAEQFRPTAPYDSDGDCIEFLARPDPFHAERVDDLVTVHYSQETGEVIGSLLKGVSAFCMEMVERIGQGRNVLRVFRGGPKAGAEEVNQANPAALDFDLKAGHVRSVPVTSPRKFPRPLRRLPPRPRS